VIAAKLLHNIGNGLEMSILRSDRSWQSHINYLALWVIVIYSASMVDNAMIGCFFELHVTKPPPIFDEYLETDFPLLRLAKSESTYNLKSKPFRFLLNIILIFLVPLRHQNTYFKVL